jgi:hypothetical protein
LTEEDLNLVMRLVRVFVGSEEDVDAPSQRMRKVGRLIDKYLRDIFVEPRSWDMSPTAF